MAVQRKLTPLPFTCVKPSDRFWMPRIETNRAATLPAEYAMCEATGCIAAIELQANDCYSM